MQGSLAAQTAAPPGGQTPAPRPRAAAAPAATLVFVRVRDNNNRPIDSVRLQMFGPANGEFMTDGEGVIRLKSLRDGMYLFRFEKEGLATFEKQLSFRGGQPDVVNIVLSPAPPPEPPPPAPAPPPPPAPVAAPAPASLPAAGELKTLSILAFLDKNFVGRERQKDSKLGCTATSTTGLLQLRDTLAEHVHSNVDETLYVVAGEGALVLDAGTRTPIAASSLSVVPKGVPHTIERHGKNPLIILWVQSGKPCADEHAP